MADYQDVTKLRKSGQLLEAYEMGKPLTAAEPENIQMRRAFGWTIYELIKQAQEANKVEEFTRYFNELTELGLQDEFWLSTQVAWQVLKISKHLLAQKPANITLAQDWLHAIAGYRFDRPSLPHSLLLDCILRLREHQRIDVRPLLDKFDYEKLRPEDFASTEFENRGKTKRTPALAERIFSTIAKLVIDENKPETLEAFQPMLERWMNEHPDFGTLVPFKITLLLKRGVPSEEILPLLMAYLPAKRRDFRAWELAARVFESIDQEKAIGCLVKALHCGEDDPFLVNTRTYLAKILISRGQLAEAKTEILRVIQTRTQMGQKYPYDVNGWILEPWYAEAGSHKYNKALYDFYMPFADELLFGDYPQYVGVITGVDEPRGRVYFRAGRQIDGVIPMDKYRRRWAVGQFYKLYLEKQETERGHRWFVHHMTTTEEMPAADLARTYKGYLQRRGQIGFADGVFISTALLTQNDFPDGYPVHGVAVTSFDQKKQQWGWQALSLMPVE